MLVGEMGGICSCLQKESDTGLLKLDNVSVVLCLGLQLAFVVLGSSALVNMKQFFFPAAGFCFQRISSLRVKQGLLSSAAAQDGRGGAEW